MSEGAADSYDTPSEPPERFASSQWYAVCRTEKLKDALIRVRRLSRELVVWRDRQGVAQIAAARCPHRGADLGNGRVEQGSMVCGYHGFRFEGDGSCTEMPCEGKSARAPSTMRLQTYPTREQHGFVWMWYGEPVLAAATAVGWLPGVVFPVDSSAEGELVLPLRFSRMMEGLVDIHHIPFVHPSLAPRSHSRLGPYEVRVDGAAVYTKGVLRPDDAPLNQGVPVELNFVYPSMTYLLPAAGLAAITVCTPIDRESTWMAIRYSCSLNIPARLRRAYAWLVLQTDRLIVQPQDIKILRSAAPRTVGIRSGVLVHADRGPAEWLRLHHRALEATPHAAQAPWRAP